MSNDPTPRPDATLSDGQGDLLRAAFEKRLDLHSSSPAIHAFAITHGIPSRWLTQLLVRAGAFDRDPLNPHPTTTARTS